MLTVDVSPSGGGTAEVDHAAPSSYPFSYYYPGAVDVVLEAVPAPGYDFDGWSGHLDGNVNPVSVTMGCNKSITANFSVQANSGLAYDTNGIDGIQPYRYADIEVEYYNSN